VSCAEPTVTPAAVVVWAASDDAPSEGRSRSDQHVRRTMSGDPR